MKYISKLITILVLVTTMIACSSILEEPVVSKVSSDYYNTETGVASLQAGIYARMRWWGSGMEQATLRLFQYGTDTYYRASGSEFDRYGSGVNPQATETSVTAFWNVNYLMIYNANLLINKLKTVPRNSVFKNETDYNQAVGEAHFFRAYHTALLVTQFGGIPLPEYSNELADNIKRSLASEVYAKIISDYRIAAEKMKDFNLVANGKLSKQAAQHFLAKVYLERASATSVAEKVRRGYKSTDADSAAYFADLVINSNQFQLEQNFGNVFDFNNAYYTYEYNEAKTKSSNNKAQFSKERIWIVNNTEDPILVSRGDSKDGFGGTNPSVGTNNMPGYFSSAWSKVNTRSGAMDGMGSARDYLLGRWTYSTPTPHCVDVFGYNPSQSDGYAKVGTAEDNNRYDSRMYKSFRFHYNAWVEDSKNKWQNTDPNNILTYNWGLNSIYPPGSPRFLKGTWGGDADTCFVITPERGDALTIVNKYKKRFHIRSIQNAEVPGRYLEDDSGFLPQLIKYADNRKYNSSDVTFTNNPSAVSGTKDIVLARLGETYLIAAEGYARAGKYQEAVSRTNVIRKRAAWKANEQRPWQVAKIHGGSLTQDCTTQMEISVDDINSTEKLVAFFLSERERELSGEFNRWIDLTRCEKLIEYVQKFHPKQEARDNVGSGNGKFKLRPIPQEHIDRLNNPNLKIEEEQNPGYF